MRSVKSAEARGDDIAVLQLINRYALAIDMHDWKALADIFTEDAIADFSSIAPMLPGDGRALGRKQIIAFLSKSLANRHRTAHFISNHIVDVDGDRARSNHYLHNRNLSIYGIYTCEHSRTPDGWRIASLKLDERVLDKRGVDEACDRPDGTLPTGVVDRLVAVADRLELHELGPRYAHLIDEQRWDDLPSIFAENATADYRSIGGDEALLHGLPAIRAWLEAHLGHRVESVPWHYITDTVVDLDGDTASCHSYMHNRYLRIVGVYESNTVRTSNGWRFQRLRLAAKGLPGIALE